MTSTATLERNRTRAASEPRAAVPAKDDAAMLKAAASLTRDLNVPKSSVYWADMLGSALLGYAALAGTIAAHETWLAVGLAIVAVLALYRAGSFIHELTHIKKGAVKGFRFTWNLIVGVPLMVPSFMYEGVHNQHHAKRYYGTVDDPEYLPLALMHPWTLPLFLIAAALAPIGMLIRFAILAPLSLLSPKLRTIVVGRYSGLQINPKFVRPKPEGEFARDWAWQEAACSIWAIALLAMVATGVDPAPRLPHLPRRRRRRDVPQSDPHPRRASVGEWRRADERHRPVPRQRQRAAAGDPARAVGAGGAALPCAPPSASGPALSCAGRGAPALVQGAGGERRSITLQPPAPHGAGRPARAQHLD